MGHKLIKDIDEETWRRFTGYCKAKGKRVSEALKEILDSYLKNKIK
ncbi:MAG: hypothetical protein KKB21_04560 [Nanoarchaeota archaeon]|nr:hypothetical protein [Nanoarchaeota archaeon]MBU4086818.1 hypothetical protein [Nanoarchaeota archaeon]